MPRRPPLRDNVDADWNPSSRRRARPPENQEPPTLRSRRSPKRKASNPIDPPKIPPIQEARQKRKESAARVATRWDYITRTAFHETITFLGILALLFAIRQALAVNPFSPLKSPENFDIDPSFSTLYNLTNTIVSHSTSHCLDLALIRNTLTGPAKPFSYAVSLLPDGNTTHSTSIKAIALTCAALLMNASVTSQTLFTSSLGIKRSVIPSLDHTLAGLSAATIYNTSDAPIMPHDPSDYAQKMVLPRREVRHLLTAHVDRLASMIEETRNNASTLYSQLASFEAKWTKLSKHVDRRKGEIEAEAAELHALQKNATFLGYSMRIPSFSNLRINARLAKLALEQKTHAMLFDPIQYELHPYVKDKWHRNDAPYVLEGLGVQLDELRKDVAKARKELAGRTPFWRGFYKADRLVTRVDEYVGSLGELRRKVGVEPAKRLLACRKEFEREMKAFKKVDGREHPARIEGGFPEVNFR